MQYLTFIRSSELVDAAPPAALQEAIGAFVAQGQAEGWLVSTGGLAPSQDSFRLRLGNGKIDMTDGPFTETKEVIGGWAVLEAASHAEIVRLTTAFMELHRLHWPAFACEAEVRPIQFRTP